MARNPDADLPCANCKCAKRWHSKLKDCWFCHKCSEFVYGAG